MSKEDRNMNKFLFVSVMIIMAVMFIFIIVVKYTFENWTTSAQFGDTFGALNTVFSALAFAGVLYTILLQRKQIDIQNEEIRITKQEQILSKITQDKQLENMKLMSKIEAINNLIRIYTDRLAHLNNKSGLTDGEFVIKEDYEEGKKIAESKLLEITKEIIYNV